MKPPARRMHLTLPLLIAAGSLTSWASGCAARSLQAEPRRGTEQASNECTVREVWRGPLKLGANRELYVEANVMLDSEGDVAIVGRPTYVWERIGGRDSLTSRNEVFGVIVKRDRSIAEIPNPLGSARVMPLTAGVVGPRRWAFIFSEVDPGPDLKTWTERIEGTLKRTWYAEYDGSVWHDLEEIPLAGFTRVMGLNGSQIVKHADTVVWAVPHEFRHGVQIGDVIERAGGEWRRRKVSTHAASTAYAEAIYIERRGFIVAFVHPDTLTGQGNTLVLYRRDSAWVREGKLLPGGEVHHPVWLRRTDGSTILSWILHGANSGNETQAVWGDVAVGQVQAVPIDPIALDEPAALTEWPGGPFWLSNHVLPPDSLQIRLTAFRNNRMEILWVTRNPYTHSFGATSTSDRTALVTGPLLNLEERKLTSLLIELRMNCPLEPRDPM